MRHIVLGGRANGLAIARGLRREGLPCDVLDLDSRVVCGVSKATTGFHCPDPSDASVVGVLTTLLADGGGVLYCTDDRWNSFVVRQREALQSAGALFPFACAEAIERVLDKLALVELASGIVDVPETAEYAGQASSPDWIVKPRFPFDGFAIRKKGAGAGEVQAGFERGEAFVRQRRIDVALRHHLSFCGVRAERILGGLVFAKRLEYPHPGGTATLSVIEQDRELRQRLLALCERLLERLDYRGPFEIEFLRCERSDRLFLIDINLRFWLQHELGRSLGVDYAGLYRRWLLAGDSIDPEPASGRVAWVHEGMPLSLLAHPAAALPALGELLSRRWLLAHFRLGDSRPLWRFLGV